MGRRHGLASYLTGAAASRAGDEMSGPALLLLGLAVTHSAAVGSALLSAATISAAIGGPVFGVLLDRMRRPGRLLATAIAAYLTGPLLILAILGHVPLPVVLLIAVTAGLFGPALAGGWTSQLPQVTTAGALPRATTLDAMTFNFASVVGPVLAGLVATLFGAAASVAASVVLIAFALPFALRLPPQQIAAGPARKSVFGDLRAGFSAILRIRPLARATLTSTLSIAGEGMVVACSPILGLRTFGSQNTGVYLLSVFAVASLAANTLLVRRRNSMSRDSLILHSTLLMAGAFLLAIFTSPALLVIAMVISGAGASLELTALFTVRHREAPAHLRGQIFTTGASVKISAYALGVGIAGGLISWSLPGTLTAAAALELAAAAGYLALSWKPSKKTNNTTHDPRPSHGQ